MDYEDYIENVIEPFQRDLNNLMKSISETEQLLVKQGARELIQRLQQAMILLIQHGDWPHLMFPVSLHEGMTTAKEVFGVTEDHINLFYERARDCFERENYSDASDICLLLTKLEPKEVTFWIALGMSEQLKGEYQAATEAYAKAVDLDEDDLRPVLYAARCLVDLGEVPLARALLLEFLDADVDTFFMMEATELMSELEGKI